eukprot:m.174649 g.174649  ORF g.174649 m.174649 type:complete len:229 (+) comp18330_c0_seq1:217-903(+)
MEVVNAELTPEKSRRKYTFLHPVDSMGVSAAEENSAMRKLPFSAESSTPMENRERSPQANADGIRTPGFTLRQAFKCNVVSQGGHLPALSTQETKLFKTLRQYAHAEFPSQDFSDVFIIRCLTARKWDITRAQAICSSYVTKLLPSINPPSIRAKDVLAHLQTGAVILTGGCDVRGASVVEVRPSLIDKGTTTPTEFLHLILYVRMGDSNLLAQCCGLRCTSMRYNHV